MKHIIIGLDPGTIRTGFAVIAMEKYPPTLQDLGVLTGSVKQSLERRLCQISQALEKIYQKYSPQETAIEQIFMGKNADSAFKLGQVVGVCSVMSARFNSSFFSYASRFIKQSVTGNGRADKRVVRNFVLNMFRLQEVQMTTDATDALAVALCHSIQRSTPQVLRSQL